MNKYEDLVQETNMLNTFATDTWALLTRVGLEPQYDSVATMGMMFLATIAKGVLHNLFEGDGILDSVCKNIVVPNVRCREIDQETFEDDPLAYVRGDIEGNDVETRRRGASELVKALRKHYEKQVTECLSGYIGHLLNQYNSNPQANWRDKDSVIYLIIALSVVGSTKEKGATAVNTLVPLENFYKTNIVPELTTNGVSPIIAASALKFVVSFRTMLPVADIPALMSAFVKLAGSNSVVVQSYASICIERFLLLRREDGTPRVAPEVIRSLLSEAFTTLFTALNGSMKENPYVMRAIMRLVATAKLEIAPVAQTALMSICNKLSEIYRNPSNPHFTHYLFETMAGIIGVLIKTENYADIEAAEKILMPAFNVIVDEDHVDLAPYMFQIVSQLVEAHKSSAESLVQRYGGLYKKFLAPQWWLRHGNVPALARLIRAFIVFAPQYVVQEDIKPVLGIFQKLVASKTLDKFGIQILVEIVRHIPYVPAPSRTFQLNIPNIPFNCLVSKSGTH
jgi:exportin-2 (importin alpha re-exporter)